jgi:ribosomal protein L35
MIFGLGTKKAPKASVKKSNGYTKSHKVTKKTPKDSRASEAAEILRKMEAKKNADSCPFC